MPKKKPTDDAELTPQMDAQDAIETLENDDFTPEADPGEDQTDQQDATAEVSQRNHLDVETPIGRNQAACRCAQHQELTATKQLVEELAELASRIQYYPGGVHVRQGVPEHDFSFPQPAAHAFKALLTKLNTYAGR